MKVPVPKQIDIGGYHYSVHFVEEQLRDAGDWGEINHRTLEIIINPARLDSQRREALIHEVLHLIEKVFLNVDVEERTIHGIAEGLNQFFDQLGIDFDWSGIKEKAK